MQRVLATVLVGLAIGAGVLFSACGEAGSGSGSPAASGSGCLSHEQVAEEESRIAEGFESSDAEVEAKRDEIKAVQAREC